MILLRPDGKFAATAPVPGGVSSFDLSTLVELDASGSLLPPKGYTFAANIHNHPPRHDVFRKLYPDLSRPIHARPVWRHGMPNSCFHWMPKNNRIPPWSSAGIQSLDRRLLLAPVGTNGQRMANPPPAISEPGYGQVA
ncbi:hypothetical protein [Pseudomonas sp. TSRC2-2]|uniref:hypothetical protein n=1 Tax=unclassified Pseudomonas TaxID=196821 RepID=UPI003CFA90A9